MGGQALFAALCKRCFQPVNALLFRKLLPSFVCLPLARGHVVHCDLLELLC